MSAEMTHDEVRAALAVEALDALDEPERSRVRAHLEGCPECRAELDALREAAGALAFAAPHRPLEAGRSDRLRARLLARAAADGRDAGDLSDQTLIAPPPGGLPDQTLIAPAAAERPDETLLRPAPAADTSDPGATPITAAPSARRRGFNPWLALAASLVLLIAAGAWAAWLNGRNQALAADLAEVRGENQRLRVQVNQTERLLRAMEAPELRVIDLASADQQPPGGRMFWNPITDDWIFLAHNLPQLPQGLEYQLWLITPGRKLPAGTFIPSVTGTARMQTTFALPPDSLQAVAVTREPAGGVPAPTGPVVIVGAAAAETE